MSFNRLQYDDKAYNLQMERAVKPGDYRLFQGSYDNCDECYPYNQPTNAKSQVSITRSKTEKGFGSMADIEAVVFSSVVFMRVCPTIFEGSPDINSAMATSLLT